MITSARGIWEMKPFPGTVWLHEAGKPVCGDFLCDSVSPPGKQVFLGFPQENFGIFPRSPLWSMGMDE